ncbi:DUF6223 family protein [Streptomyces sp. NPDC048441]|uniref:DUF6223 family protein n=1 Tax=Streptomyces sp. NPDC048441 TaxID=3365552 RepID=UPI00372013C9
MGAVTPGSRKGADRTRTGGIWAIAAGSAGTLLAVLHLATSSGGPGTGNGLVGAVAAVPVGLGGMFLGRLALTRLRRAGISADRTTA